MRVMSSLFKHLRVHQVFGANTDVGKTILTCALVRATASKNSKVYYLKPVSTGPDADDEHVRQFSGPRKELVHTECLWRFKDPVSPHLAVGMAMEESSDSVLEPSDETFVKAIAFRIKRCATEFREPGHMFVETSGGVHSPNVSGNPQLDSYRPLFLPTILIGDSKLGGISSTVSAYESLRLRGFIIDSVLLFRDNYYRNWEYLTSYFSERGVNVSAISPPPPRAATVAENFVSTNKYYESIIADGSETGIGDVLRQLDECHTRRLEELESMPRRALDTIWWPFVQHGLVEREQDVSVIDSARSDFFSVYKPSYQQEPSVPGNRSFLQPQFDGSASWWTQALGHAHPSLAIAAAGAAGRYGHVMFPQAVHLPALKLAERLVHGGPGKGWAARAFFSDDGSTGMEIALKMALRYFSVREGNDLTPLDRKELGIIGLKGSYHGDTIGAMDACEEGVYTCEWHNAKGYWFEPPRVYVQNGEVVVSLPAAITASPPSLTSSIHAPSLSWVYDITQRLQTPLAELYWEYIERTLNNLTTASNRKFAALVLEPLVMGAGGMIFVDPLFQRVMVDVVRGKNGSLPSWSGLPIIFDDVFVGLYRVGVESPCSVLGVYPDISVNAKILTGGLVPLAVTLASDAIFQSFNSKNKTDALLHGHSYTAHPIGCDVANESFNIVEKLVSSDLWNDARKKWAKSGVSGESGTVWSFWDPTFVDALSRLDVISEVMALGTVLTFKVNDEQDGYGSHSAQSLLQSIGACTDDANIPSSIPGAIPFSIHFRTLGDVAYFMTSLNTPSDTVRAVEDKIWTAVRRSSP